MTMRKLMAIPQVLFVLLLLQTVLFAQQKQVNELAAKLQPFVDCLNGSRTEFAIKGEGVIAFEGKPEQVSLEISRSGDQQLSLWIQHPAYGLRIDRTAELTRLCLPKHKTAIV